MSDPEARAELQALARAARVEKIALTLAASLDALPEKYTPDVLEDALAVAFNLHMNRRLEAARQQTAARRAADNPMDEDKPHE